MSVCALTCGRGLGKTQVAGEVARRAVEDGCPVVAWVSGESQERLLGDLAVVAEALGVADPEGDSVKSARSLRTQLQSRAERGLLVIDNAVLSAGALEFAPTAGGTRTVVTSTERAFTAQGVPVEVGALPARAHPPRRRRGGRAGGGGDR